MEAQTAPIAQYHDEELWLEERRKHLTPSNIAAIFGDHPYQTAQDVQDEKLGLAQPTEPTPAMLRGQILEPVAVAEYEKRKGRKTRRIPMIVHRERPLFAASIDRQILTGPGVPTTAGLEIKVPMWRIFSQIKRQGLLPYMIYQGQLEAEVAGYPFTAFGIFNADLWQLIDFDLELDRNFTADMMDRAEEWWKRHIINREPVEVAEPPENLPEVEGEILTREDAPFLEAVELLLDLRDVKKEAEEAFKAAQAQVKATLGAFGAYEGGGARIYYTQRPGRASKDWKALERCRPVDPALLQTALLRTLTDFPGIEEMDVLHILQHIGEDILLDLSAFEKVGNPFEEVRPYRLKNVEV